jgi:hypothetical protein
MLARILCHISVQTVFLQRLRENCPGPVFFVWVLTDNNVLEEKK